MVESGCKFFETDLHGSSREAVDDRPDPFPEAILDSTESNSRNKSDPRAPD